MHQQRHDREGGTNLATVLRGMEGANFRPGVKKVISSTILCPNGIAAFAELGYIAPRLCLATAPLRAGIGPAGDSSMLNGVIAGHRASVQTSVFLGRGS